VASSRTGAKSRTHGRKVRSTGTKERTRVGRKRQPRAHPELQSACLRLTFVSYGESKWTMGWFRQKVPWLSRLALFALAVQIVLSFGHVHVSGAAPASAAGMNALAVESNSTAAPGPALPTDRDRNSPAHDLCALCASISLLHSLVLPVPAALAALGEFDRIQFRYASATAVLAQQRSPSQARAPPFA
jgi:hypothetical protein